MFAFFYFTLRGFKKSKLYHNIDYVASLLNSLLEYMLYLLAIVCRIYPLFIHWYNFVTKRLLFFRLVVTRRDIQVNRLNEKIQGRELAKAKIPLRVGGEQQIGAGSRTI